MGKRKCHDQHKAQQIKKLTGHFFLLLNFKRIDRELAIKNP